MHPHVTMMQASNPRLIDKESETEGEQLRKRPHGWSGWGSRNSNPGSGAPPGTHGDLLSSDTWGAEKWGFDIKLKYFLGTLECLKLSAMKDQCVLLWAFGF